MHLPIKTLVGFLLSASLYYGSNIENSHEFLHQQERTTVRAGNIKESQTKKETPKEYRDRKLRKVIELNLLNESEASRATTAALDSLLRDADVRRFTKRQSSQPKQDYSHSTQKKTKTNLDATCLLAQANKAKQENTVRKENKRKRMVASSKKPQSVRIQGGENKDTRSQTTPHESPKNVWGHTTSEKRVNLHVTLEGRSVSAILSLQKYADQHGFLCEREWIGQMDRVLSQKSNICKFNSQLPIYFGMNEARTINGIHYSGHALDRIKQRKVDITAIEQIMQHRKSNKNGLSVCQDIQDNIRVVTAVKGINRKIVTVYLNGKKEKKK